MRYLSLALLLLAAPLAAQDSLPVPDSTAADTAAFDNGCTFTVVVQKKAVAPDSGGIAIPQGSEVLLSLTAAPDSSCLLVDGDGSDGTLEVSVPAGDWDVLARVIGKKGDASINDVKLARLKGKPQWTDVTAVAPATPGAQWTLKAGSAKTFQIRLVEALVAPAE